MRYLEELEKIDAFQSEAINGERSQDGLDQLTAYTSEDSRLSERAKTAWRLVYERYSFNKRFGRGVPTLGLVDGRITEKHMTMTTDPQPLEALQAQSAFRTL